MHQILKHRYSSTCLASIICLCNGTKHCVCLAQCHLIHFFVWRLLFILFLKIIFQYYTNGTVECFGDNEANAVGTQAVNSSQVTAGGHHTCALLSTGLEVTCWGDNTYEQAPNTVVPANGGDKFKAISAGATHTCAYVVNAATGAYTDRQCWGFNVSE